VECHDERRKSLYERLMRKDKCGPEGKYFTDGKQ
jgi:hypothetical protein